MHLEIYSHSNYAPVYSTTSAVGLLVATGNIGKNLSPEELSKGLYVSRDGGIKWKMAKAGNWIYEIGDHGALIVIARKDDPTDELQFSLDEGATWNRFKISDRKIVIQNIIIEPKSVSQQFLVHGTFWKGYDRRMEEEKAFFSFVDFSSMYVT